MASNIRIHNRKGFSLSEMLVAVLILSLVATGLATGISSSIKVYNQSLVFSNSQTLASSVINAVTDELRFSTAQQSGSDNPKFDSATYGKNVSIYVAASGTNAGKLMIGSSIDGTTSESCLISAGLYGEGVKVNLKYSFDSETRFYTVNCTIKDKKGNVLSEIKDLAVKPISE